MYDQLDHHTPAKAAADARRSRSESTKTTRQRGLWLVPLLLGSLLLSTTPDHAAAAELVADINTFANPDRSPFGMANTTVEFSNRVWYAARQTPQSPMTLWSSNLSGSRAHGGLPAKWTDVIVVGANERGVFFTATKPNDAEHGLFVTDGVSTTGLMMLGYTADYGTIKAFGTSVNGTLFVVSKDESPHAEGLYVTDGTSTGTKLLADVPPLPDSTTGFFQHRGNSWFFTKSNPSSTTGVALWRTNGTPSGTRFVRAVGDSRFIHGGLGIVGLGAEVYFQAMGPTQCRLWRSDGTYNGTVIIDRIGAVDDATRWCPGEMAVRAPDVIYYKKVVNRRAQMWRHIIRQQAPSTVGRLYTTHSTGSAASQMRNVMMWRDALWFSGLNSQSNPAIFRLDPTNSSSIRTIDIGSGYRVQNLIGTANKLIFNTSSGPNSLKTRVHQSNGTSSGTQLMGYIRGDIESRLVSLAGVVAFQGSNAADRHQIFGAVTSSNTIMKLSNFEGASLGSKAVATDIVSYTPIGSQTQAALFCAVDTSNGRHALWRSDGTEGGTRRLIGHIGRDTTMRNASSSPYPACGDFAVLNNQIYYAREFMSPGAELWTASVNGSGERLLMDIPGIESRPKHIQNVGGSIIASAKVRARTRTLIRVNTQSGSYEVLNNAITDPIPVARNSNLSWFLVRQGIGPSSTFRLWQTDGSRAGTFLLASNLHDVSDITVMNGRRYMLATDSRRNQGLFRVGFFDDRQTTPELVARVSTHPSNRLIQFNNQLILNVGVGVNRELWRSNGTANGTDLVLRTNRHIIDLTVADGSLWFGQLTRANETTASATGWQLMRSDGSEAGTYVVHEERFSESLDVDAPDIMRQIGDSLLFFASTLNQGVELWRESRLTNTVPILPPGS